MIYTCQCTIQRYALLSIALLLASCTSIVHKPLSALTTDHHKIAIFFDGTHNDITTDTNIKRLHSLITLQDKHNISSIYIEGVGVDNDLSGAMFGTGMAARVRIGYEFILNHYQKGDEIYIFGFSRGAYAARILTSILYNAGLVTTNKGMSNHEVAKIVFRTVKCPYPEEDDVDQQDSFKCSNPETDMKNREDIRDRLNEKGLKTSDPVDVEVLGLWDTVEAMGVPDWISRLLHKTRLNQHIVNIDGPNKRYGDQLCNVKHAYQALSIDDDREWIFTPLPLSRTYLFNGCKPDDEHLLGKDGKIISGRLREVWFSGAHSDVGGGYDDSLLSGVSLNWMIENLTDTDLISKIAKVPEEGSKLAKVPEDQYGTSHDPESGWLWTPLYHKMNRDIATYVTSYKQRHEFRDTVCVHESVLKRRQAVPLYKNENSNLRLLRVGDVYLVPAPPEFDGWIPQLREATEEELNKDPFLKLELQVLKVQKWPECDGMKPTEKTP